MLIRPTNTNPGIEQLTWLTTQSLVSTHLDLRKFGATHWSRHATGLTRLSNPPISRAHTQEPKSTTGTGTSLNPRFLEHTEADRGVSGAGADPFRGAPYGARRTSMVIGRFVLGSRMRDLLASK